MRITISAICIRGNSVLLVKKRDVWTLPEGQHFEGEPYSVCLIRENREQLPNATVAVDRFLGSFDVEAPAAGGPLVTKAFFARIGGEIAPASETSNSGYFKKEKFDSMTISDITRKILDSLVQSGRLK